jgi:polysaccharide biosynthesis transport protein
LKEYVDPNFKKGEEVERYLRIPFLGIIPRHDAPNHEAGENGAVSEAYQTLRTRLQLSTPTPVKTLLVTSAVPAEGKTTTVVNLGKSFAQVGHRVLLVDVDLRHPSLHRYFHLTQEGGLTDILGGPSVWGQVVHTTSLTNRQVLCAGTTNDHAAPLLHTGQMQDLIAHLRDAFDMVIFDAPIVLGIPDVEILASRMDGVLLVHQPARANKEVTLEATKILGRARAPLLGMIFNNVNIPRQDYYRPHSPVLQLPA